LLAATLSDVAAKRREVVLSNSVYHLKDKTQIKIFKMRHLKFNKTHSIAVTKFFLLLLVHLVT
jgi:hypothetical protein